MTRERAQPHPSRVPHVGAALLQSRRPYTGARQQACWTCLGRRLIFRHDGRDLDLPLVTSDGVQDRMLTGACLHGDPACDVQEVSSMFDALDRCVWTCRIIRASSHPTDSTQNHLDGRQKPRPLPKIHSNATKATACSKSAVQWQDLQSARPWVTRLTFCRDGYVGVSLHQPNSRQACHTRTDGCQT